MLVYDVLVYYVLVCDVLVYDVLFYDELVYDVLVYDVLVYDVLVYDVLVYEVHPAHANNNATTHLNTTGVIIFVPPFVCVHACVCVSMMMPTALAVRDREFFM